ncbi:MAG: hypothetical protein COA45_04855 [Zetaproteobacteria bacterium]|nr:MAG: hypothetical protein COA45_04855 [Zetaproteobacteria bacterium]
MTDFLDREDVKQLIGNKYDFYRELRLSNYESVVMGEPKKSIKGRYNIFAFFLFPVWAGYRKLYYILGILILFILGAALLDTYFDYELSSFSGFISLFLWMSYQDLYFEHIIQRSRKLDKIHSHEKVLAYVKRYGGTSTMTAVLCIPVSIAIMFIIAFVTFLFFPPPA